MYLNYNKNVLKPTEALCISNTDIHCHNTRHQKYACAYVLSME